MHLTQEVLREECLKKCNKHKVNFKYFYDKLVKSERNPNTIDDLLETLDEMMAWSFWNDYERMFADDSVKKRSTLY